MPIIGQSRSIEPDSTKVKAIREFAAKQFGYSFKGKTSLAQIAQFVDVMQPSSARQYISEFLNKEIVDEESNTYQLYRSLARFPFSVYLTTRQDNLVERALTAEGKAPAKVVCFWNRKGNFTANIGSTPTANKPVVFYLQGQISEQETNVLTEDEHLDFMMNLSRNKNLLPPFIQSRLVQTPLLFIDYYPADWTFRSLLQCFHSYLIGNLSQRSFCISFIPENEFSEQTFYEQNIFAASCSALHIELVHDTIEGLTNQLSALQKARDGEFNDNTLDRAVGDVKAFIGQFLDRAVEEVEAFIQKGIELANLGESRINESRNEEALELFEQSVAAFDKALTLAPDDGTGYIGKGNVLTSTGNILASLSQPEAAQQSYARAIEALDKALALHSNDLVAQYKKTFTLAFWGDLLISLSQPDAAQQRYAQAIEVLDKVLVLEPNFSGAYNNKGNLLGSIGDLLAHHSPEAAQQSYVQAIEALDKALALAPDDATAHNNKGTALIHLGNLLASLSQPEAAQQSYARAIEDLDKALALHPDYVLAHNNKGDALTRSGNLLAALSQNEAALRCYEVAHSEFIKSLEIEPNDEMILAAREELLRRVKSLYETGTWNDR